MPGRGGGETMMVIDQKGPSAPLAVLLLHHSRKFPYRNPSAYNNFEKPTRHPSAISSSLGRVQQRRNMRTGSHQRVGRPSLTREKYEIPQSQKARGTAPERPTNIQGWDKTGLMAGKKISHSERKSHISAPKSATSKVDCEYYLLNECKS